MYCTKKILQFLCLFLIGFQPLYGQNLVSEKSKIASEMKASRISSGRSEMSDWNPSSRNPSSRNPEERKQTFPISISLTNHSWSFPMANVFRLRPIYPGIAIGTEFYYLKRPKSKLFQTVEFGGFVNNSQGSAIYFNTNFTYRYTTKFGLMSEFGLGLGYFKSYHRTATFQQQDSGEFEAIRDKGVGAGSGNIAFALGYDLSKKHDKKWTPFIRYQWIASGAYWSIIGIRPNGLLHLGVQINLL